MKRKLTNELKHNLPLLPNWYLRGTQWENTAKKERQKMRDKIEQNKIQGNRKKPKVN